MSVLVEGTLTFGCSPNNTAIFRDTQETASAANADEGYTGKLFMNKDGFMQLDLGLALDAPGQFANNSIIFDKAGATFAPTDTSKLPLGRWSVLSTDGDSPDAGGIPKLAYAVRYDTGDAKAPKSCPAGQRSPPQPYYATYNFYTCDQEYTAPVPTPGPSAILPARPLAPVIARPPIVLPPTLVPLAMTPTPAPMPAPAPAPAPAPIVPPPTPVVPAAVAPAPAPSAAATAPVRVALALAAVALPFLL